MSDIPFNIAKGSTVDYYRRVKLNDPSTSVLTIVLLATSGIEADATLQDYDDLATLLAAANNEPTNTGYVRKELTDSDLAAVPVPDDTNNRFDIDLPDITWTTVATTGGAISKLLVCYDPITGSGTDSSIIPLSMHDFVVTPNGLDIVAQINAAGFYRAA